MFRSLGVMFLAAAIVGCGVDDQEAAEDVTEIAQPIFNGSTDFTGVEWMRVRTGRLEPAIPFGCSGTVLDDRTILTARHCVTGASPFAEIANPPSQIQVRVSGGTNRPVESIVPMEPTSNVKHDVALVFVSLANSFRDAVGRPIFTPMEINEPERYVGHWIRISGWGLDSGLNTGGVLRHGIMTVDDDLVSPWPREPRLLDGIVLRKNSNDQIQQNGDSGGPYWGGTDDQGTVPRGILGVHSAVGVTPDTRFGTRVFHLVRLWARNQMSIHHGLLGGFGWTRSFGLQSDFTTGIQYAPGGTPGIWSISGGALIQFSNVGPTHFVWERSVVRDFTASVQIHSPDDDDSAGIVFHHVDPNSYYYCEANDQENAFRIRSRINGTITTLASATWNGTFAIPRTMTVNSSDYLYQCRWDGILLNAFDRRMPVGAIGLYQDHNEGVRFDNLQVTGGIMPLPVP